MHPHLPKLKSLLNGISTRLDQQPSVIVIPHASNSGNRDEWDNAWTSWNDFVNLGREKKLGRTARGEIEWARLGFDWPLWILFSSGTTGTCSSHRVLGHPREKAHIIQVVQS